MKQQSGIMVAEQDRLMEKARWYHEEREVRICSRFVVIARFLVLSRFNVL